MTNKKGNNKDEDANGDEDDSNLMMAVMTFCNLVRWWRISWWRWRLQWRLWWTCYKTGDYSDEDACCWWRWWSKFYKAGDDDSEHADGAEDDDHRMKMIMTTIKASPSSIPDSTQNKTHEWVSQLEPKIQIYQKNRFPELAITIKKIYKASLQETKQKRKWNLNKTVTDLQCNKVTITGNKKCLKHSKSVRGEMKNYSGTQS